MSHMNVVVDDYDACVQHFCDKLGGNFMLDLPGANWHACLIEIGGLIIEFFAPPLFVLNSRHGPHYLGIEYEAPMDEARPAVAANGLRIMRELQIAFHTEPADGFGVDYELFEGTFYGDNPMAVTTRERGADYWRNQHPAGFTGPLGYTQTVAELEPVANLITNLFGAQKAYEADRPTLAAKAWGMQVEDHVVELVCPTGPGPLWNEMGRQGAGIRSTVFGVADVAQARAWLEGLGLPVIDGTAPGAIAIEPSANCGILFEFAEKA